MGTVGACALLALSSGTVSAQLCGDADNSGAVTVTDGVQVLRAAAGLPSACNPEVCDVDGGGSTSVTDGVNVLRAAAGLDGHFSCANGPKRDCRQAVRTGNLTSAATFCADAEKSTPNDGEVRGLAVGTSGLSAAFAALEVTGLADALGFARVGSSSDICGVRFTKATSIPTGAPTTEVSQDLLQRGVVLVDTALADLAGISADVIFPFNLGNLPTCTALVGRPPVEIDFGDVLVVRAILNLLGAFFHAGTVYDIRFDLRGPVDDGSSARDVFLANPNLLTIHGSGNASSESKLARNNLDAALTAFVAAIDSINAETDDQSNDLFVLAPADQRRTSLWREAAIRFRTALHETAVFEASVFGFTSNQRLSLRDLFDGDVATLRPFVPGFNSAGKPDICQFSDPTFGGHAPDLTQAELGCP